MQLVCIRIYLKSILRYKFLILNTYHPGTSYLREQECEDPGSFSEPKGDREQKSLGNTAITYKVV
jgi:hypothetical protein